ncbi:TPA: PIN domain-containing protein [Stenotrophomonas maltophilia]|jgi:PIN domain|uniref:PIN domain-containing protein n=1 Tax=Stenotrophomonas maltophilia TaxID=40324 RepID=UPI001AA14CC2|nr:PIN domain-containing protein [Stenotrophomonas maltophilia]ELF4107621.1 DUF4935 domain-containing protein [Stenotrophomonas maltophilia]MBO1743802.1 DUF4935 domain-containing protein [Stenotrophomonas maltophilia]HEA4097109.1 DUF4935 domain-containing protein [Stenotrophomonas maltophilia]
MPSYPYRVFVDANVWIGWGQGFRKAEASTLEELIEHELIKLVCTDLTIIEVAKHFRDSDLERLEPLTKSALSQSAKLLLGIDVPVVDKDEIRASFFERHRKFVTAHIRGRMRAEVLSIDNVKPSDVLNQYTHSTGMFAEGKKNQFPDAFIFGAVSDGAGPEDPLIIWSLDGDFTHACEQSEHITQVKRMPQLFEALGIIPEGEQKMSWLEECHDLFTRAVHDAIYGEPVQARDEDDAEMEVLGVLDIDEVTVTSLYRIHDEASQYIGFGRCEPKIEVRYSAPDWDSAAWNSEEKVLVPLQHVDGQAVVELDEITFSFLAEISGEKVVSIEGLELKGMWGLTAELGREAQYDYN